MRGTDHHWMALELMSRTIAWVLSSQEAMEKIEAGSPSPVPDVA